MKIGIVGLPNVGKSTLFNALTRTKAAQAANYPFCTIDPNVGIVEVPDRRIDEISKLVNPNRIVPAIVEFVDIAGLVKGAASGEGLGNKFLANIRECQAIAQVVRVFKDGNVIHVHEAVDPKRDIEIIETELILADLETVQKRAVKARSEAKSGDKKKLQYADLVERIGKELEGGKKISDLNLNVEEMLQLQDLHLLTAKPFLYIANVGEDELAGIDLVKLKNELGIAGSSAVVPISAKVEEELVDLPINEADQFLKELGLVDSGLNSLIREAYSVLGLQTYFTAGKVEVRAWTIQKGWKAPQAAGVIHSDFEKGFIRAEVIGYEDFVSCGGEQGAKDKGLLRVEGKEYVVQDGDVMHFRSSN